MLQYLPYALAAYGGYRGYQDSRDQGISGINRLLNTATGAALGYNLGTYVPGVKTAGFGQVGAQNFVPSFTQLPGIRAIPGFGAGVPQAQTIGAGTGDAAIAEQIAAAGRANKAKTLADVNKPKDRGSLMDMLFRREVDGEMVTDPLKVGGLTAAGLYLSGAFEPGPTDIYMPGYNMGVLDLQENRPGYSYIDPETGEEKAYEKMYLPEEAGRGQRRMGNISFSQTRLKTGGLAEIKKFNEGGINYLPSKVSHDENDANNYVRASGYVEDGSGNGNKDEDTMLAQLADGEFVTRADGVLGAGIIAGANPNSMKDMREKGAKYFYEQQARYKRVFDLLKEKNGDSKQKTN